MVRHVLTAFASKTAVFLISCTFVVCLSISHANAQQRTDLPTIGTAAGGTMSIERERLIGDYYMRQLRAQAPMVEDPVLREYLTDLGNKLVMHSENVRFPFTFFWIRDSNINAFAFLGGYVGVHTGLVEHAQDESELASVLAHEVAHVTQRHIARNMERMQASAPVSIAQIVGGLVLAMANPQLGMAVMTGGIAGMQQRQINYTRQFELEADRFGMNSLYAAGFDPHGAPRFFARLAARFRYSTQVPQYLVTHPLPESRIGDTRSRADALGGRTAEPSLDFELAKARISIRYGSTPARDNFLNMQRDEQRLAQSNAHQYQLDGLRYAQALALFEMERYSEADEIIQQLHETDTLNLFYIDTIADIWLAQGRYDEVIQFLTRAYMRRPNNQVITINLAYAATQAAEYELSVKILQDYLLHNREDRVAYELLYDAQQKSGNAIGMHEAMAELHILRGLFELAIEELHHAYSKTPDYRELSRQRIQGRIEQARRLNSERERVLNL